jgi:large conductance mechanosensitive channel
MAGMPVGGQNPSSMIGDILRSFRQLVLRGDLFAIAAALLMALAAYFFLQTLVEGLIAPAVAAVFGKPSIHLLSFTINHSEFSYGSVLVGLILFVLAFIVVAALSKARQGAASRSTET